jgi:benzoate-CoA ligase
VTAHEDTAGEIAAGALELSELCAAASPDLDPEPTSRDDMCFWQYSSGTTGAPKAVVHLHHDLWEVTERYGHNVIGMSAADRSYSVPKLFFSYGLGNSLAFPFRYGATVLLDPLRPDPRRTYELLAAERPTLFYAVPTFYASLLGLREDDLPADLSSVRLCISAGEPLPRPLYERWKQRFGLEILDGIGSTEVGYIFVSNSPGRVRPGTSGQVVPGYQAKVIDDEGRPAATGATGTLWVKGDSSFAFYWNQHERTKRTIVGEWVVTGDSYSVDADGYYTYRGRADDMLKVGARWVSPVEVESALLEHPAVAECAVVGREDEDGLTRPVAYAVLRDGGAGSVALAEELRAFARERLAHYKCPRWIEFVGELPKTTTGKVQRYRLRERTLEREGAA